MNLDALQSMRGRKTTVYSVDDRVELIAGNIAKGIESPEVHTFTAQAVNQTCDGRWCVSPRDWMGEVEAVAHFIQDNIRYTLDVYDKDTYRTPQRTIQLAIGDCDDMAALSGSMLMVIGYPVMLKAVRTTGNDDFHHIYLVAGVPPHEPLDWVPVDPTQSQPVGWEAPNIEEEAFYELSI